LCHERLGRVEEKGFLFAGILIKKRRYWPCHVPGEKIEEHFENLEIGAVDAWRGQLDGDSFHLMCLKEPDYIMSMMTTYGTLTTDGEVDQLHSYVENSNNNKSVFIVWNAL